MEIIQNFFKFMKFSIIVPTYNNLKYLKFFLNSIKKNSFYKHEIIIHVNEGSDGTYEYIKKNGFKYTYSNQNIGLCLSMNTATKLVTSKYVLYSHDDMYFCKNWDKELSDEIKKSKNNLFYFTGLNISKDSGLINYDCGTNITNFNKKKFDLFAKKKAKYNYRGSHWAPHIVHKTIWDRVGGFSKEFNPGDGSDPDFCMKLWKINVRNFKCISNFKVYHFNSVTTRKRNVILNNGTKTFLLKYGFTPVFFRKYYLKSEFLTPLDQDPKNSNINLLYFLDYLKVKTKYFYQLFTLSFNR